jgi:hypothetical protein
MSLCVAPCRDVDEFRRAFGAIAQYIGVEPTDQVLERFVPNMPIERMQVVEVAPGSASRADAMFRVDRQPWCPEMF